MVMILLAEVPLPWSILELDELNLFLEKGLLPRLTPMQQKKVLDMTLISHMEKNLVWKMILTVAKDQCLTPMTLVHQERAQNMMETTPMHPEKAQTMILTIQMLVFPSLVLILMIQLVAKDPQDMILITPIHPGKVQHMILIIRMLVMIPVIEKDLQSMTLTNLNQLQERGLNLIPMTPI